MNFQNPLLSDDSLRTVLDTVLSAPAYQWTQTEPRLSWISRWWRTLVDWLRHFRETNPTTADILFWTLALILVLIFVHGGWIMYRTIQGATAADGRGASATTAAIRDDKWYHRLADALAAQGRFAEAMQAAFTGLMLRMDARGILRFHPSKTPREYTREARLAPESLDHLRAAVGELYDYAYAGRPSGLEQYRHWRAGLDREWHVAQS